VKNLIFLVGIVLSSQLYAAEDVAPAWKHGVRRFIVRVIGEEWGTRILGEAPQAEQDFEIELPDIPKVVKKTTDLESYNKKIKAPTEFDQLPRDKKRQFDYRFIEELFMATRKTDAKDEDMVNWLNTLEQGGSREGVYQALTLDEVYSGLENMGDKPTKRLLDFCLKFSQKFLLQTFKPESLSQLNLYSLKRIFTERGLDLLDHFETNDLDKLYRWYAVFSSDLAKDQGSWLKSDIRKNASAKFHYQWAKEMPVQHVKSEFIIKMHTVMNGLQLLSQE
jgi:hypothetical protein